MNHRMWVDGWSRGSLDDTPPSDDVIPPLVQVPEREVAQWWRSFGCVRALFGKSRLRFPPIHTATVVRRVVSPAATPLRLFPRVQHPPERWEPPHETHRGAYPQLRCVWPNRWQRLHCSGHFGASYVYTDPRMPQSSVSDRTFDASGPRVTDTMKCGWEGGP